MQKQRLGRGLGALIGEAGEQEAAGRTLIEVPVSDIRPNPFQPRIDFDPEKIEELAGSIAQKGVLQPLIVTRKTEGGYELVVGERRLRAASRAGLSRVPCIVMDVRDEELLEVALVENLQREDLDPIEEARAYELMMEKFDLSHEEVARRVGRNRSTVTNSLRLLRLPEEVRALVRGGQLTAGHARTLIGIGDREEQVRIAKEMVEKGLSVREAEEGRREREGKPRRRTRRAVDPAIRRVEEELQRHFGTLVKVKGSGKGSIVIKYYSMDDLNRILEILGVEV
jgi:ParB family chromosome partitioning protein